VFTDYKGLQGNILPGTSGSTTFHWKHNCIPVFQRVPMVNWLTGPRRILTLNGNLVRTGFSHSWLIDKFSCAELQGACASIQGDCHANVKLGSVNDRGGETLISTNMKTYSASNLMQASQVDAGIPPGADLIPPPPAGAPLPSVPSRAASIFNAILSSSANNLQGSHFMTHGAPCSVSAAANLDRSA
jgi:hypothetical protein